MNRSRLIVMACVAAGALAARHGDAQGTRRPRVEAPAPLSSLEGLSSLSDLASLRSMALDLAGASRDLASLRSNASLEGLGALQSLGSLQSLASLQGLASLGSLASIAPHAASWADGGSSAYRIERRLPRRSWNPQDPADSLWREGRRAVADGDYRRASRLFAQLVDRYPRSEYVGDALYWQAWSIFKNAQESRMTRDALDDAIAALDRQARDYPKASTSGDAGDLRARIRSAQARLGDQAAAMEIRERAQQLETSGRCPSEDDDVRVAALQGLLQMDAESALPILRQVLAKRDACSVELRQQAVFMVSQKRGDESTRLLLDVARTDPNSDVRAAAIQWLGQSRSDVAITALDSILNTATDNDMREKAIFALSQQRDPRAAQALRRFVENERMPDDLRANGIFWLGQQHEAGASAVYLRELFGRTRNEQIREAIIQAMAQSRDADASKWLIDMAVDRNQPVELRKNALFAVSQQRQIDFRRLASFYDEMKGQEEMQQHVIWLLSQRREPEATDKLMDIARNESNRELRKTAIFWLGQKKDPRVVQFLMDLLK